MLETITIIALVAASGAFLVWKLIKSFRGETECCGTASTCSGNCKSCSLVDQHERN